MGHVYLFTGNGGGKTTNSLGIAMRSLAHGKNVLIVQFMKWNDQTGEYLFAKQWNKFREENKKLPEFKVVQYGRKGWHGVKNLTDEDGIKTRQALHYAYVEGKFSDYKLVILDEINYAVHCKLLDVKDVKEVIRLIMVDDAVDVIMTGRHASKDLKDFADFVNEINVIKTSDKMVCTEGIQW